MAIGDNYVGKIKNFEGLTLKPVWDYKQWTSGYGTRASGPNDIIDKAEAERRFSVELAKAENLVDGFAPNLDPGTRAALTSLTYNAGTAWQNGGLGEAVKSGNPEAIKARLVQYNKAGGTVLPGLVDRRGEEASWIGNASADQTNSGVFDPATGQLGPKPLAMVSGAGREQQPGTPQPTMTADAGGLLDALFGESKGNVFTSLMAQQPPSIPQSELSAVTPVPIRPVDPAQLLAIVQRRGKLGSA